MYMYVYMYIFSFYQHKLFSQLLIINYLVSYKEIPMKTLLHVLYMVGNLININKFRVRDLTRVIRQRKVTSLALASQEGAVEIQ